MSGKGWIKLHRSILDSDTWQSLTALQRAVLMEILLRVNYKPKRFFRDGIDYNCQPGQLVTSYRSLADFSKTTKDTTFRCLKKLKALNFLKIENLKRFIVVTIINWDFYQSSKNTQQIRDNLRRSTRRSCDEVHNEVATTYKTGKRRLVNGLQNPKMEGCDEVATKSATKLRRNPRTTKEERNKEERTSSSSEKNFLIKKNGFDDDENTWLFSCFIEKKRSRREYISGCENLRDLISLSPSYLNLFERWKKHPVALRMAAYAFVNLETKATDQFNYALDVAENPSKYDGFERYRLIGLKSQAEKNYIVELES